jgi:hypothetical protein
MLAVQRQNARTYSDHPSIVGEGPEELLVEPNVSMRQPLTMLLTIVVRPFTWGCQQVAPRV